MLLALAVVDFHAVGYTGTGHIFGLPFPVGSIAVRSFYVISGFYMALILSGRYARDVGWFYQARALRLYPAYWLVLAATVAAMVAQHDPGLDHWRALVDDRDWPTLAWAAFTNLFMVGLDWNFFAGPALTRFNLIPQAWTLGLELTFYAVAPLLVRCRTVTLVVIIAASLGARAAAYSLGYDDPDTWRARFFPFEIVWFLAGMVAYRAYGRAKTLPPHAVERTGLIALVTCIAAIFALSSTRYGIQVVVLALVPFVFAATKDSKIDSVIGEFSYPIYLCHYFILQFIIPSHAPYRDEQIALWSIVCAALLLVAVRPIERRRHQLPQPRRDRPAAEKESGRLA
jgi:peptidoglycan/LPS O-acetylase OafA/YrhL